MDRKFYAVIVAAGSGLRLGSSVPKQFLDLDGKPVLRRTMEQFLAAVPDVRLVVVLPRDWEDYWKQQCIESNFNVPQVLSRGGLTRFHSVQAALAKVPDGAVVAVHDGVRPLVSPALIRRMLEMMEERHALIPVTPVADTLKVLRKEGEELLPVEGRILDRSEVYAAQTPQMFRSEDLKAAYTQPYDLSFTDDASVAASYGIPLSFVEGERYNLKITTVQDLEVARKLVDL
ncbi:MAG: 2-C-methyl-D-erythritol 4-phosphate cytidylyltransferase [Bacteroidales bacterium]|jgi:2-C-methyl-D-erythritol 4-phosphate cytidylyltransferase|nr:2-C-methyl-D-erythritol 4-phosphate cytidylyltransferase [Bacteroidales bacterium]MCR5571264.1 2-C-methyl-D-erythritol 4-phosphate cytidylyltransferase [Bacteroidales bacterium]